MTTRLRFEPEVFIVVVTIVMMTLLALLTFLLGQ
jgi:hypothetical protein